MVFFLIQFYLRWLCTRQNFLIKIKEIQWIIYPKVLPIWCLCLLTGYWISVEPETGACLQGATNICTLCPVRMIRPEGNNFQIASCTEMADALFPQAIKCAAWIVKMKNVMSIISFFSHHSSTVLAQSHTMPPASATKQYTSITSYIKQGAFYFSAAN